MFYVCTLQVSWSLGGIALNEGPCHDAVEIARRVAGELFCADLVL